MIIFITLLISEIVVSNAFSCISNFLSILLSSVIGHFANEIKFLLPSFSYSSSAKCGEKTDNNFKKDSKSCFDVSFSNDSNNSLNLITAILYLNDSILNVISFMLELILLSDFLLVFPIFITLKYSTTLFMNLDEPSIPVSDHA